MAGKLYLVGTPIGNLGDLSPRAGQVLEEVDFIAAEDTRVSLKILNHLGIKKQLVSYFEHNKCESGEKIIRRLLEGESCALVTDAGMPAISDPGESLVELCAKEGIEVLVVPGPCAAVSALALSGLPTQRFTFEGFLSVTGKSRTEHLRSLQGEKRTMIFYEAPHKLVRTLEDMVEYFGTGRRISLCRELTKLHEQVWRTTLSEALTFYRENPPRGEFVLVLEGAPEEEAPALSLEDAVARVLRLHEDGERLKDAAMQVAEATGFKKNELYQAALEQK